MALVNSTRTRSSRAPGVRTTRGVDPPWLEELSRRSDTLVIEVLEGNRAGLEATLADHLVAALTPLT